jgi:hypothetical protein
MNGGRGWYMGLELELELEQQLAVESLKANALRVSQNEHIVLIPNVTVFGPTTKMLER